MNTVSVNGTLRTDLGKKATKAVKAEGSFPCVMYGGDAPIHFSTTHAEVKKLIFTPNFQIAEVNIGGQKYKSIIKSVSYNPVTEVIEHIDFLQLIDGQVVKVELPLRFEGVSPGVRAGGRMVQSLRRVKVKTTPEKLVDVMHINIGKLGLGQSARVREIIPAEGVEIMNNPSTPVAIIEIPRAMRSAATAAAKAK